MSRPVHNLTGVARSLRSAGARAGVGMRRCVHNSAVIATLDTTRRHASRHCRGSTQLHRERANGERARLDATPIGPAGCSMRCPRATSRLAPARAALPSPITQPMHAWAGRLRGTIPPAVSHSFHRLAKESPAERGAPLPPPPSATSCCASSSAGGAPPDDEPPDTPRHPMPPIAESRPTRPAAPAPATRS